MLTASGKQRQWLLMAAAVIFLGLIIISSSPNLGVDRWLKAAEESEEEEGNLFDKFLKGAGKFKDQNTIATLGVFLEGSSKQISEKMAEIDKYINALEKIKITDEASRIAASEILPLFQKIKIDLIALATKGRTLTASLKGKVCPSKEEMARQLTELINLAKGIKGQIEYINSVTKKDFGISQFNFSGIRKFISNLFGSEFWISEGIKGYIKQEIEKEAAAELVGLVRQMEASVAGRRFGKLNDVVGKYWTLKGHFIVAGMPSYTKKHNNKAIEDEVKKRIEQQTGASAILSIDLYIASLENFLKLISPQSPNEQE